MESVCKERKSEKRDTWQVGSERKGGVEKEGTRQVESERKGVVEKETPGRWKGKGKEEWKKSRLAGGK